MASSKTLRRYLVQRPNEHACSIWHFVLCVYLGLVPIVVTLTNCIIDGIVGIVKKAVQLKLTPTGEQRTALLRTLAGCNEAANFASERMRTERIASKFSLHHAVYADLKARGSRPRRPSGSSGRLPTRTPPSAAPLNRALKGKRKAKALAKPSASAPTRPRRSMTGTSPGTTRTNHLHLDDRGTHPGPPLRRSAEAVALVSEFRRGETDLIERAGSCTSCHRGRARPRASHPGRVPGRGPRDRQHRHHLRRGQLVRRSHAPPQEECRVAAKLQAKGTKSAKRLLKKRSGRKPGSSGTSTTRSARKSPPRLNAPDGALPLKTSRHPRRHGYESLKTRHCTPAFAQLRFLLTRRPPLRRPDGRGPGLHIAALPGMRNDRRQNRPNRTCSSARPAATPPATILKYPTPHHTFSIPAHP